MPGPDFLIVGAAKAGTTFFVECLRQHPNIYIVPHDAEGRNVLSLYIQNLVDDWRPYLRCYPLKHGHQLLGEKNNHYMFLDRAPQIIKETLGCPRLIFLLRNPVNRSYSHYCENVSFGRESRKFLRALKEEYNYLKRLGNRNGDMRFAYLERSLYMRQIRRYLDIFPRESMLFIISEELWGNPDAELQKVFHFLGLESVRVSCDVRKNFAPKRPFPSLFRLYSHVASLLKPIGLSRKVFQLWPKSPYWPQLSAKEKKQARKFFVNDVELLSAFLRKDLISLWFESENEKLLGG